MYTKNKLKKYKGEYCFEFIMKVLVISDSHDRKKALKAALDRGKKENCQAIFFCGDSSSPETFQLLVDDGRPLYAVLGNIEKDSEEIKRIAQKEKYVTFDPHVLIFRLNNKNIGIVHYPDAAKMLAKKGNLDAIFHGHTHTPRIDYSGRVLIGNPGEISGHISGKRSFGIYISSTNSFQIVPFKVEE